MGWGVEMHGWDGTAVPSRPWAKGDARIGFGFARNWAGSTGFSFADTSGHRSQAVVLRGSLKEQHPAPPPAVRSKRDGAQLCESNGATLAKASHPTLGLISD